MTTRLLTLAAVAFAATDCGAIYPQYTTIIMDAPPGLAEGGEISPPPETVMRIAAVSAELPQQTRDARPWDSDGAPDAYVVFIRNDREVYRSRVVRNSIRPTWDPAHDFADLHIEPSDALRVELRDDDGLTSDVVGLASSRGIPGEAHGGGQWVLHFEAGAVLTLSITPPPPRLGMGLSFEYHSDRLVVLSLEFASAARTAGLRVGDRIVAVNGRAVSAMTENEARDALNRNGMSDVTLSVQHEGRSTTEDITVRRDALYPSR